MNKRLFVGSLPFSITQSQLETMFSEHGKVLTCNIINDRFTGKSKGFAFIDMEAADADKAMQALNGAEIDGRKIIVNEARPMEERPPRRDFRGRR
jgi:RNA recognition motif-containing protein